MASTSSVRPASDTNKEDNSIFDDVLFNEFVDGDQFDFSDSSYARSASATSGDSWFDKPSSGAAAVTGSPPLSPKDFDVGNKTFMLDNLDDSDDFPIDPVLDAAATAQDSAPSTPARGDGSFRKLPSTVETVRRSQPCRVKKGDRRRQQLPESPSMSQPTSRRAQHGVWANQLERSVDPQALQSPTTSRYAPMSPPQTVTQIRYQQQQQQQYSQSAQSQQHRLLSHSSLVSPLSQGFPPPPSQPQQQQQQQARSYFSPLPTPLTSTHPHSYAQQPLSSFYQPLDPYLTNPSTSLNLNPSSFPTFSNPFPDADTAWEHDPILSSMNATFPDFSGSPPPTSSTYTTHQSQNHQDMFYNDTKVQPWAPPASQSFYQNTSHNHHNMPIVPISAPLASTQQQYYANNVNPTNIHHLNTLPNPPMTAQPFYRSTSPVHTTYAVPPAPTLLSVPKTRRRNHRTPSPETDSDSDEGEEENIRPSRTRTSRSKTPLSPAVARSRKTRSPSRTCTRDKSKAPTTRRQHHREVSTTASPEAYTTTTNSRSKSHHYHSSTPLSPSSSSPRKSKSRTTSSRHSKAKGGVGSKKDPFVNLTASDSAKILTGVAPSGSSKTKAKRDKEEADKRRQFSEVAKRAVREAGGDVEALERVGLY